MLPLVPPALENVTESFRVVVPLWQSLTLLIISLASGRWTGRNIKMFALSSESPISVLTKNRNPLSRRCSPPMELRVVLFSGLLLSSLAHNKTPESGACARRETLVTSLPTPLSLMLTSCIESLDVVRHRVRWPLSDDRCDLLNAALEKALPTVVLSTLESLLTIRPRWRSKKNVVVSLSFVVSNTTIKHLTTSFTYT